MKFLDYTGLSRLTTNIKSYIATKLQPIDDRTPLYMEGMCYALGNAFLSTGSTVEGITLDMCPTPGSPVTLTPNSTGNAKKLYDRFAKGLPSALMVPVTSSTFYAAARGTVGSWPFLPDSEGIETPQTNASTGVTTVMYRCALDRKLASGGVMHDLKVVISRPRTNPGQPTSISIWASDVQAAVDDTPLMPFHAAMFSVNADGAESLTNSSGGLSQSTATQTLHSTDTGDRLEFYNRMQKGFPPAISIGMTLSDGTTKRKVWLYPDSVSGSAGTAIYKSGTVGNGTYSNYYFQMNVIVDTSSVKVRFAKGTVSA